MATACYLATSSTSTRVTVLDPASTPCIGASSQCEGVVGTFGFPHHLQELGDLSWPLFREFSETYNGHQAFGYSPLVSHAVFSAGYDPYDPRLPYPTQKEQDISKLPRWLKTHQDWSAGLVEDDTKGSGNVSRKYNVLQVDRRLQCSHPPFPLLLGQGRD